MDNFKKPKMLDLGCGKNKIKNKEFLVIGIDAWKKSDADVFVSCPDIPFKNQSIDKIYTRHFFEHFVYEDLVTLLKECIRILKENGEIEIIVPHYSCISAFQDPTHRMFFTKRTFYKLGPLGFRVQEVEFNWFRKPYTGRFPLIVKMMDIILKRLHSLERFFGIIGGVYEVRSVLIKDSTKIDPRHIDGAEILD